MRYFLELSYNGKPYHGWQVQPNAITVQEVVEKALSTLLRTSLTIVGAGRTDTGVHARHMVAHFDYNKPFKEGDFIYKLNSFLPKDIAIHKIYKVNPDAHARFDALSRTYHYRIRTTKSVFDYDYTYYIPGKLNLMHMEEACGILLSYKDFQCFSKAHTDVNTYTCDIKEAFFKKQGSELIFVITADRFLRNMVRAIMGTLVQIGLGKTSVEDLHTIIKSKSRSEAGFSVPAHGLYLAHISYPEHIRLTA